MADRIYFERVRKTLFIVLLLTFSAAKLLAGAPSCGEELSGEQPHRLELKQTIAGKIRAVTLTTSEFKSDDLPNFRYFARVSFVMMDWSSRLDSALMRATTEGQAFGQLPPVKLLDSMTLEQWRTRISGLKHSELKELAPQLYEYDESHKGATLDRFYKLMRLHDAIVRAERKVTLSTLKRTSLIRQTRKVLERVGSTIAPTPSLDQTVEKMHEIRLLVERVDREEGNQELDDEIVRKLHELSSGYHFAPDEDEDSPGFTDPFGSNVPEFFYLEVGYKPSVMDRIPPLSRSKRAKFIAQKLIDIFQTRPDIETILVQLPKRYFAATIEQLRRSGFTGAFNAN